ncbi:MAG: hypothetical protein EA402_12590 [Planctomycetota bacterium]|nr:MAG: hypothetical protein EA402_12590 [Planctomycetota bacterium]
MKQTPPLAPWQDWLNALEELLQQLQGQAPDMLAKLTESPGLQPQLDAIEALRQELPTTPDSTASPALAQEVVTCLQRGAQLSEAILNQMARIQAQALSEASHQQRHKRNIHAYGDDPNHQPRFIDHHG